MSKLTKKQNDFLYTKDGNLRSSVKIAQDVYEGNGLFRPVESSHRGGRGTMKDVSYNVKALINAFGYKYTTRNDAPKGGKSGDFIKVSKLAGKKLNSFK
jgi:hypothetical protein